MYTHAILQSTEYIRTNKKISGICRKVTKKMRYGI